MRQRQERLVEDNSAVEAGIRALGISEEGNISVFVDEDTIQTTPSTHTMTRDIADPLEGENRSRSVLSRLKVDDNAPRPSPGKSMSKKTVQRHVQLRQERNKAKHILQTEGIQVLERVYLGGKSAAANGSVMVRRNVRAVVNVTKDIKCYFEEESLGNNMPSRLEYLRLRVDDDQEELIHQYFDQAADFIEAQLNVEDLDEHDTPPAVFIHCQMGQSRSPSIVIAYAMKKLGWSLKRSYRYLSRLHANLKINDGFKSQLMEYERETHGELTHDFFDKRRRRKHVDYCREKVIDSSLSAAETARFLMP